MWEVGEVWGVWEVWEVWGLTSNSSQEGNIEKDLRLYENGTFLYTEPERI